MVLLLNYNYLKVIVKLFPCYWYMRSRTTLNNWQFPELEFQRFSYLWSFLSHLSDYRLKCLPLRYTVFTPKYQHSLLRTHCSGKRCFKLYQNVRTNDFCMEIKFSFISIWLVEHFITFQSILFEFKRFMASYRKCKLYSKQKSK